MEQATTTIANPLSQQPTTATKRAAPEQEWETRFPTAGEIVGGSPRHQILWSSSPDIHDWWAELPADYQFNSNQLVPREIKIKIGRKQVLLGLLGSIQGGRYADIVLADGSKGQLDMKACEFKVLNADTPTVVAWELTKPQTWALENHALPMLINDAMCDFRYTSKSEAARNQWLKLKGRSFPTHIESVALLEAARATVDDAQHSCTLIDPVLEFSQTNEPSLAPHASENILKLLAVYQPGSCLHDACQVVLTMCRDSA